MKLLSHTLIAVFAVITLTACDSSEKASLPESTEQEKKALTTKPAYIVFTREKTLDQAELETYWQKVPATLEGHSMKVLSGYGPYEVLEGDPTEGVVIAEFPSMEAARKWYHSPAYQEACVHRFKGAVYRGILVEANR